MPRATTIHSRTDCALEEAAELISELALGLTTGHIAVADGEQVIQLHPTRAVSLAFAGAEDQRDGRLIIELTWKTRLRIDGH